MAEKTLPTAKKRIHFTTKQLVLTAILSAVGFILMQLQFVIPLMPSFVKFDFSELPALIAAFTMGPISGVVVCLVKNILNLTVSSTGGVGELSNFCLGATLVIVSGNLYKLKRTRTCAALAMLAGSVAMAAISFPANYFITYPFYQNFMPLDAICAMYREINPNVTELWQMLLMFNVPFTFAKGLAASIVTFLIYKKLSFFINGKEFKS